MLLFNQGNLRTLLQRIDKLLADAESAEDPANHTIIDNNWYQDAVRRLTSLDDHREQILNELRNVLNDLNREYMEVSRRMTRDNRLLKNGSKVTRKSV